MQGASARTELRQQLCRGQSQNGDRYPIRGCDRMRYCAVKRWVRDGAMSFHSFIHSTDFVVTHKKITEKKHMSADVAWNWRARPDDVCSVTVPSLGCAMPGTVNRLPLSPFGSTGAHRDNSTSRLAKSSSGPARRLK